MGPPATRADARVGPRAHRAGRSSTPTPPTRPRGQDPARLAYGQVESGCGARIRTVNLAVNSPCRGCPGQSSAVHDVPIRSRLGACTVHRMPSPSGAYRGIRDTSVTPTAPGTGNADYRFH